MNTVKLLCVTACVSISFIAGCARQKRETINQICVSQVGKAELMDAAEEVLTRMHFTISKSDSDLGYIRSRPLRAAQWFELWRQDNVGTENSTEANLHTIQRTVELNINKRQGQICVDCEVKVQRLALFEDENIALRSHSQEYEMFSERRTSLLRKRELKSKQKSWIELGRDDRLGTKILEKIEKKISNRSQI